MSDQTVVLLGVGAYLAVIVGIGFAAGRKVHDPVDYIVAGRRLPLWLCTFTVFATWFGGGTCVGAAGAAFEEGFLGVVADPFGAGLCLFLAGFFYIRILRRMRMLTLSDFFRVRFGRLAELLASVAVIPAYLGWVASQFVAFGFILNTLTGVNTSLAIVLGATVVVAYTMVGGLWAVTLTDFVQALVLISGLAFMLWVALSEAGGWSAVKAALPQQHFELLPAPGFKDWIWYVQAWLVIGFGGIPTQDLFQRSMSARNESIAQNSAYIAGLLYLTVGLIPVLLGIVGAVLMPDVGNPEHILPMLALNYLHPVGMALVLGALLSAIMSSADSALLAPASIFGENIAKFFKKDLSDQQRLRLSRWAVPVLGVLSLMTGLYFKAVYELIVNTWSVILVSLFVPLTAGLYWKKANRTSAVAAIVVGLVSWIVLEAVQSQYPADLMATALAALTMAVLVPLTAHKEVALPLTTLDGTTVAYGDRLGLLSPFSASGERG